MKKWKGLTIKVIDMRKLVGTVVNNARSTGGCNGGSSCMTGCASCDMSYWIWG